MTNENSGASIKHWHERYNPLNYLTKDRPAAVRNAMQAEIAELRAALASKSAEARCYGATKLGQQCPCQTCESERPSQSAEAVPVAWAVYADNGNVRIWFQHPEPAINWARLNNATLTPLYAAPIPPAEAVPVARGTFACPICGKDTPHGHSTEEIIGADFFVIVDGDNRPEFVTKTHREAQEHINDACGDDVEGASKWKSIPVAIKKPQGRYPAEYWNATAPIPPAEAVPVGIVTPMPGTSGPAFQHFARSVAAYLQSAQPAELLCETKLPAPKQTGGV